MTSTENASSVISFHVMFDVGPFFVYGEIVAKDTNDLAFTFSKRYIEKNFLISDRILTFYDPIACKWDDTKENHPGLIVHTVNYLQQVNLVKYRSKLELQAKYKQGEILNLNGTGLIIGKRGERHIFHLPTPFKVNDKISQANVYNSNSTIRSISFNFEGTNPYIYIADYDDCVKK